MGIITKTVEVKTCDLCNNREDEDQEVIRKCNMCGNDFCCQCGEVYVGQIGLPGYECLTLCKKCLKKIVKFKEEFEDEETEISEYGE